jgi:transposase
VEVAKFDIQGTVHKEFVPPGQTANGKFYCEVLKRLREGIRRKRPDKWKNNKNWFLHHDNTPAHTLLVVRQFLTSENITVIPNHTQPPYSPDLVPCEFILFPKMKLRLKGRRLDTIEIRAESQEVIDILTFENFQGCMKSWKHAGIAVYLPKGATSKETVEIRSYGKKRFYGQIPGGFG